MDDLDARILHWEATHPNPTEGAALAAATKLGITRTTWNMRLLRILDTPAALEADAVTVYRLKRIVEKSKRIPRDAMGTWMGTPGLAADR